jgi:hypothetical protein
MAVSAATYDEIAKHMKGTGYGFQIIQSRVTKGELLDMHGLALIKKEELQPVAPGKMELLMAMVPDLPIQTNQGTWDLTDAAKIELFDKVRAVLYGDVPMLRKSA